MRLGDGAQPGWRRAPGSGQGVPTRSALDKANIAVPSYTNWLIVWVLIFLSNVLQRPIGQEVFVRLPSGGFIRESNNAVVFLGALTFLAAGLLTFLGRRALRFHWSMVLGALFLVLCFGSALWSGDPVRTTLQSLSLTGVVICVYYMYCGSTKSVLFRSMYVYAALFIFVNLAVLIAFPTYAIHQAGEFYGMHAGRLRGLSSHKNDLAKVLSACFLILVYFGRYSPFNKVVQVALLVACVMMMFMTGSAKTVAAIPVALLVAYFWVRTRAPAARLFGAASITIIWVLLSVTGLLDGLISWSLGLLGRDPTLSSRTLIWEAVMGALRYTPHWWLGGGYGAGWSNGISEIVRVSLGSDTGHPHNGFIEVLIDLGIPGLVVAGSILGATFLALALTRYQYDNQSFGFSVAWLTMLLLTNLVGSYLFSGADVITLLIFLCPLLMTWDRGRGHGAARSLAT